MTPLLTRLARRAEGLPPGAVVVAAPALPARFEPPDPESYVAAVTAGADVAAAASAPPVADTRAGAAGPAGVPRPSGPRPPSTAHVPATAAASVSARLVADHVADPVADPVAGSAPAIPPMPPAAGPDRSPPEPAPRIRSTRPAPTPDARRSRAPHEHAEDAAALPAVRVSASPAVEPVPPRLSAGPARGRAHDTPREPDVVQVTIGRVEVRGPAPVPAPAPPAPSPPRGASGPEPLSLGDYLRGKREAR